MPVKLSAVLLAVLTALCALGASAQQATGVVYDDANTNGARDAGERGIARVLVSNGVDVVETGRDGRYTIGVTDDTILFVIKPRGWMTPVGPGANVPRFYYIHKSAGSPPQLRYKGVAPTGPLPASVDFPLHRQREQNRFRVLCFGDTQTRNVEEVRFLAHDILEEVAGSDAAFGITLGDNVFNDLTVFEPLVETMSTTGIPWRYVPGNHDHNHDAPTTEQADETLERVFGPPYYAFNYGPVHFIVLNDIRYAAMKDEYHGGLGERQLAFIKNDLAHVSPKQLIVLLMHIPLTGINDASALYALLAQFPHTFSLSAHTHSQEHLFIGRAAGWQQEKPHHHLIHGTACGSWWGGNFDDASIPTAQMADGVPNGYSFITFDGTDYDVEYRAARRPADCQMNVWLPAGIKAAELAATRPLINVYAGSERSRVETRVGKNADWTPAEPYLAADPFYAEAAERQQTFFLKLAALKGVAEMDKKFISDVRGEFKSVLRGLPEPDKVPHVWRATLPATLAPGAHVLEVRTTDMFGHTYTAKHIFNVQ